MSETLRGAAVIGQSGGPTVVINQSLVGYVEAALKADAITQVLGARHGVQGMMDGDLIDLGRGFGPLARLGRDDLRLGKARRDLAFRGLVERAEGIGGAVRGGRRAAKRALLHDLLGQLARHLPPLVRRRRRPGEVVRRLDELGDLAAASEAAEREAAQLRQQQEEAGTLKAIVTALSASLAYYDGYRTEVLVSAQCVQAQRDSFGAHGFMRLDRDGAFTADWGAPSEAA